MMHHEPEKGHAQAGHNKRLCVVIPSSSVSWTGSLLSLPCTAVLSGTSWHTPCNESLERFALIVFEDSIFCGTYAGMPLQRNDMP